MTGRPIRRRGSWRTWPRLYPELRPLRLRSNVGQSPAIAAGIDAARGDWIATLDADLQNDPADLARLWEALPGHDVALGWRVERGDVWSRRAISRWANRVRNARAGPVDPRHGLLGADLPPGGGVAAAGFPRRASVLRARCCCARAAGWSRCRSVIGRGRTAGRTTTCGTGRSRWSSTCSASPG